MPTLAIDNLTSRTRTSLLAAAVLIGGWLIMYMPTYLWLAGSIWKSDEQGHGPLILAVSGFLIVRAWDALLAIDSDGASVTGSILLLVGVCVYILGRSQSIYILDVGSQLLVLASLALLFKGYRGLRLILFPIMFLVFMVPLPSALVAAVTAPLKLAVSTAASVLLYEFGFPIARSGVTLSIGQYQLLVADACAGLNSMFTLEALGLLYMNLMNYKSVGRNIWLAVSIVPISFVSNVTRVIILILVTYYFGDEAGQGFVHGFAGMLLFMVALMLILPTDRVIGFGLRRWQKDLHVPNTN